MKEMSLKDIQDFSLDILQKVDIYCINNRIDYSLGYGALIGAIRHHNIIPWDDDIDIIMTRPNYNRFVESFNKSTFASENSMRLIAPELGNGYFSIARVCDMSHTIVKKYYKWTDESTGLWIDIFPIDSLPDDGGATLRSQNDKCWFLCGSSAPISMDYSLKRNLKTLGKKLLYCLGDRGKEIRIYNSMIAKLPPYGSTDLVCNFGSPYGIKDTHRRIIFEKFNRVVFGNIETMVISEYDTYLRTIYGDYMQLPPVSKRVRGHTDNKYYWI
jgi:LPS biosynthesis protein